jgi:GNAT superfamily N-acetyltransferase
VDRKIVERPPQVSRNAFGDSGNENEMTGMTCRDAALEDGPAIGRVWVEAWRSAYAGLMPEDYLAGLDATAGLPLFERALRGRPSILVLEWHGSIVGFSRYGPSRDADARLHTGEVMAINVSPSCWRRGLGKALLGETLQRLRHEAYGEATLWVLYGNARARQFYEASGWRLDGDAERHDATLTGFPLHEVRYRVTLLEPRLT